MLYPILVDFCDNERWTDSLGGSGYLRRARMNVPYLFYVFFSGVECALFSRLPVDVWNRELMNVRKKTKNRQLHSEPRVDTDAITGSHKSTSSVVQIPDTLAPE